MNPRTSWDLDNVGTENDVPKQTAERLVFAVVLALIPVAVVLAAALILHALRV